MALMTSKTPAGAPVVELDTSHSRPALSFWRDLDDLAASEPIYWNTAGGFWMVMRYDWAREVYQHPELFSSDSIIVTDPAPSYRFIPTNVDPPDHAKYRRILNPVFAPQSVARLEPLARERAGSMVDSLQSNGSCDVVAEFAGKLPTELFLGILGLPLDDAPQVLRWVEDFFAFQHAPPEDQAPLTAAVAGVRSYFTDVLARRQAQPLDPETDFLSRICTATVDARQLTDEEILNICDVLVFAGLDTVKSQFGYSFLHLAQHRDDRARLVAEPALWSSAVEELLRLYAIVANDGRKVTEDIDFHGYKMRAGDMVMVAIGSACRDPNAFENPHDFVPDRASNRHISFAAGPHRCLGSHLARMELRVGLEEWHRRIPDYRLGPGEPRSERGGMLGLHGLVLQWSH
jgi:cytochrome P450